MKALILFALMLAGTAGRTFAEETNSVEMLPQPANSPLVTFRILFHTGAASDPEGKEGVAALTAAMIAEGGSQKLAYEEILKRMYPMATSFEWQVDKEMTVFTGITHVENLDNYYSLIRDMVLEPGFRESDFQRLKSDALNFLTVNLREGNDEELGKERLYNNIHKDHPYGHHNVGTVSGLENLAVGDVKAFYRTNYNRANVVVGIAGGFSPEIAARVQKEFALLPTGEKTKVEIPDPALEPGMHIDIVQRDTRSTAFSLGFPIEVTRGHEDYAALALATSWFGQHRSSNSHLFQRLREARGLNYGDYAYIEYFPRGMYQFQPDPNLARREQIFQIWLRPVPPEQAHFTLRAALFEYDKLVKNGLTREAFESTRAFLGKYVDVLLQTQSASLGYALDSRYYDIPEYAKYLKSELAKLTLEKVNRAIKKHLKSDNMRVVIVTKDAEGLKKTLLAGEPSPITYNSPKPEALLAEDKLIEVYPVPTKEEWVRITPVGDVFQ